MQRENYFPQVFIPQSMEHAKDIILSDDPTGEKWVRETDATARAMIESFARANSPLTDKSILLDYGCGIGRMAKRIIELTGCTVLGLDISPGMLHCSVPYVNSDRFIPCPQSQIAVLTKGGLRVDAAISVWTLQHCLNPAQDIAMIHEILKPNGLFFVVNKYARYLPITPTDSYVRWYDDKIDVLKCLGENFELAEDIPSIGNAGDDYYRAFRKK